MNKKGLTSALLALSVLGAVIGYVLTEPFRFGICTGDSVFCYNLVTKGFALQYGMMALAVIFFALLVVPQAFNAWKKFAIWFVPLTAFIFATYGDPGSGDLFSPYPEDVFRWGSIIYVAVSAIIIALKHKKIDLKV